MLLVISNLFLQFIQLVVQCCCLPIKMQALLSTVIKQMQQPISLDEAQNSYPRLLTKEALLRDVTDRERPSLRQLGAQTTDMRAKFNQKGFFQALEEQHRLISRQNMQLLGLTISKISYSQKNKKFDQVPPASPPLVAHLDSWPDAETFIDRKLIFTRVRPQRMPSRRGSAIRVRDKSAPQTPQRRRRHSKPINPQYANPIYDARIQSYRELLFKLLWSYGRYIQMDRLEEEGVLKHDRRFKASIGPGNNSALVKQLMKRRFWWHVTEERSLQANFLWTQLKVNDYFKKQQPAEPIPMKTKTEIYSRELTRQGSKQMSRRLKKEEKNKEDELLYKVLNQEERIEYVAVMKNIRNKQPWERQMVLKLKEGQYEGTRMHNHLQNNFHLGNKKALFYNLKQYYELTGGNLFKTIPLTFHIRQGLQDPQYKRFVAYHKKRQTAMKKQQKEGGRPVRNIWIVKPGELTNRGNGITVIDEVYELDSIMKAQKKHDNGTEKTFIVQLYLDRPLLYKKRKFDLRHYMLLTQLHGVFKAYWYAQGYVRTTSYEFDIHNFDREIHLTNDAVQKYTPLYGRYQPANKLSYPDLQKYLDTTFPTQKPSLQNTILPRMKAIALDAVKSSYLRMAPERLSSNFQVLGLDFMIDGEFQPWLIEINTNPCLQLACPLLTRLIPQMLDQAFRLTVDVLYPPPTHYPNTARHFVPDASLENLKFQLIFDQRVDGQTIRNLYRRNNSNLLDQIGDVSDDEVYEDNGPSQLVLDQLL